MLELPPQPESLQNTRSLMDRHHSALHHSIWRLGKVLRDSGPKVFQIESTINTDAFPSPFDFLSNVMGVDSLRPNDLSRNCQNVRPYASAAPPENLSRN